MAAVVVAGVISCLSVCLSTYRSIFLSIYLPTYLSVYLSIYLSIHLSFCKIESEAILRDFSIVEIDDFKNKAILRDFLSFRSWQHKKTKQLCETSLKMES